MATACLCLLLLVVAHLVDAASSAPSVAWSTYSTTTSIRVTASDGQPITGANPGPEPRCDHAFAVIPYKMVQWMAPTLTKGTLGADDVPPTFAFMHGGTGANGAVLSDSWLLRVTNSEYDAKADWTRVRLTSTPTRNVTQLSARAGFSLEYLPASQRLVAFGGVSAKGSYYSHAWEYVFNQATLNPGGWRRIDLAAAGISTSPVARASNGGWIVLPQPADATTELESLLFFGGATRSSTTQTGRQSLDDLWKLQLSKVATGTGVEGAWSKPENPPCVQRQVCPDAASVDTLFPQLTNDIQALLATYKSAESTSSSAMRPEGVGSTLDMLLALSTQLGKKLNQSDLLHYADTHNVVDGACTMECVEDESGLAVDDTSMLANHPSARAGHRISLVDWTNPTTDERLYQLVLFGGNSCIDGRTGASVDECFDPSLYFLDLTTLEWSVVKRPEQPPATPVDAWPERRAYHTQQVYTTSTTAQLWIIGGEFTDAMGTTTTYKNDFAVYDLVARRWFLSNDVNLADPSRIGSYGTARMSHAASARAATFLGSNGGMWLHGGCNANGPVESSGATLWLLRLGTRIQAKQVRVTNDAGTMLYGQGASVAQPGLASDGTTKANYFYMTLAQNKGAPPDPTYDGPERRRDLEALNAALNIPPLTRAAGYPTLPFWGYPYQWASLTAAEALRRIRVQLVGAVAKSDDASSSTLAIPCDVFPTDTDGTFVARYHVSSGLQYNLYVWFDGVNVPGSPFFVTMKTAVASPTLTYPTSRPIPPVRYTASGAIATKHYGNFETLRDPLASPGSGLQRGIRGAAASFLLQVVDIFGNAWVDNTNAVRYTTDSTTSAQAANPLSGLSLAVYAPDMSTFLMKLDPTVDYHWINNEDGTFSVTYRVPDLDSFALQVRIDEQPIAGGQMFLVEGIEQLELSNAQGAALVVIEWILIGIMFFTLLYFFYRRWSPVIQSRSLYFDVLFFAGLILAAVATLQQTPMSGGQRITPDGVVHNSGGHNPCLAYNFLIGLGVIMCFGSIYAMVRRSHIIYKRIKQSALSDSRQTITLNQDFPNARSDRAPIPVIPNMQPDWHILRPVAIFLFIEIVFQILWLAIAPLKPSLQIARDNFRSYQVCDGANKEIWVYCSVGLKLVMCCFFMYFIANGRKISDPIGEARSLAWCGYNMAVTCVLAILIVFFVDQSDSIKTSFIIANIAVFWVGLGFYVLIFAQRIAPILKEPDQFWYDSFILQVQDEWLAAKAALEKSKTGRTGTYAGAGSAMNYGGGNNSSHMGSGGGAVTTPVTRPASASIAGPRPAATSTVATRPASSSIAGGPRPAALSRVPSSSALNPTSTPAPGPGAGASKSGSLRNLHDTRAKSNSIGGPRPLPVAGGPRKTSSAVTPIKSPPIKDAAGGANPTGDGSATSPTSPASPSLPARSDFTPTVLEPLVAEENATSTALEFLDDE